jgi:hypothetical protein
MPDRTVWSRSAWPWTTGTAVVLAAAFLIAPRMGTDLSAQQARADFFAAWGWAPIDFSWYGGVNQFGYSLFTAWLGAAVGVRVLGAVAALVAALAFQRLLTGSARRPLLGGVLGAVVFTANLVSGRITFAVGLAFGLLALCGFSLPGPRWRRLVLMTIASALATWASPVAGLFLGVAGAALLIAAFSDGLRLRRARSYWPEAAALCVVPVVALAPMALLFGDGGSQPFTADSMRIHIALALLVVLVVPARLRVIRIGAALSILLLIAAFYLPSPVGSNALRLPLLFTVPVAAAFANLARPALTLVLVAVCWWQPPVVTSDLYRAGSAESGAAFYRPLTDEIARLAPGRVEVVPLQDHWESAYVAAAVPLARGWERQVDTDRNALFYRDPLLSADYAAWLRAQAVTYVAVAPGSTPDHYARSEAALVLAGTPALRQIWSDRTWRLYQVVNPQPLVSTPATLVAADRGGVTLDAPTGGEVIVRVRWSRWLTLRGPGGCLAPGPDDWATVRVTSPGRYRLTSSLRPSPRC